MKKTLFVALALAALAPMLASARTYYADGSTYNTYNYSAIDLSCSPQYQSVAQGAVVHFTAGGNVQGPFQWVSDEGYSVVDQGPYFDTPFFAPGRHQVDVVWGSQRATCYVDVGGQFGYAQGGYAAGPNVTLTSYRYPSLPNAGFAPQTLAGFAFAAALLIAAGIALYPHARKAFAFVTR